MRKFLIVLSFAGCGFAGCGASGTHVISGGVIDDDGWPVRQADATYRCPDGTYLDDNRLPDGGREVTCKRLGVPRSLGFALRWNASALTSHTVFDEDGLPVSRRRWYSDGALKSTEIFEDGIVQRRESWFPTGVHKEQSIRDGELLHVSRYQPDGSIEAEGTFRGERKVGKWVLWRDGATETVTFQDGKEVGRATRVFLDSTIEQGVYEDGKKQGLWKRETAQGLPVRQENYKDGVLNGAFAVFHPNQAQAILGQYTDGARSGVWTTYHPNGQVRSRGEYGCDKEQGHWVFWHSNGQKSFEGDYVDGTKVGEWNHFAEDGTLMKVDMFQFLESKCLP